MKINNQTTLPTIMLLVLCFGLLASNAILNYIPAAYSQGQDSSFRAGVDAIDNMPAKKVKMRDIDVAYKQLGRDRDKPIVLITGCCTTMDMWSPTLLKELSSNRTVIIFDKRGPGESTIGTREFSINQFANDTAGLLDALKI
jgi:alpha/beta hydrolase family protein